MFFCLTSQPTFPIKDQVVNILGGTIAHVFGFFYPSCLWLCLKISSFHPPPPSARSVAHCPHCPCLCLWGHWWLAATSVTAVAGITTWGTRMVGASTVSGVSWVMGTTTTGEGRGEARVAASAMSGVVEFTGTTSVVRGTRVTGASATGGTRVTGPVPLLPSSLWPQSPLRPGGQSYEHHLPCCYRVLWGCGLSLHGWEARILCTASTVSPVPPSLHFSSPSTFRHAGVWNSGILVCWAEELNFVEL